LFDTSLTSIVGDSLLELWRTVSIESNAVNIELFCGRYSYAEGTYPEQSKYDYIQGLKTIMWHK